MCTPVNYRDPCYLAAVEHTGGAADAPGKCLGIGGILFDHELHTEIVRLGARYLTAGNDVEDLPRRAPMPTRADEDNPGAKTLTYPAMI